MTNGRFKTSEIKDQKAKVQSPSLKNIFSKTSFETIM
jgi:hypothetical protein